MADFIISQHVDLSSWITLYMLLVDGENIPDESLIQVETRIGA
jgi:hypothetical protein